ncbi:MAG: preprotein translocase subunit SecY [Oscillospiraceae bacterium]|nr:preprotein translocase subunit SecY [Oscillospiraceae bacterium]MDD3832525.1 preprotein translocase subunit SecY [Oscillospiraceae bacterium]MDD4545780.1 preprotein translocase subunit SecY [Oscillospiraceae bacterium]
MFQTLRNAWKITDLRKKILYTLFIVLIFRLGSAITLPFINVDQMAEGVKNIEGPLSMLMLLSGGGFSDASIFALSITPYINASIIIQLLTVAIPPLERLAKEGESGRKKLGQITRYTTIALGIMLGIAYFLMIKNKYNALEKTTGWAFWFSAVVIVLCFTAGSALMMWLGEQINERGIGNGISMLLFAGILSRSRNAAIFLWNLFYTDGIKNLESGTGLKFVILVPVILILFLAIIAFIVVITDAERRIPVQYAKRVVGRKMYGGQNTYIPIKVNMSGVMPIILAASMVSVPSVIFSFTGTPVGKGIFGKIGLFIFTVFNPTHPVYASLYFMLIIGFAFFYVTIQYNPLEMSNNLRKNSGAIPGYRPGRPTVDYIKRVLNKITLIGAICLGVIATFPIIFSSISGIDGLALGGTSIMIIVGVAIETTQQIESQMMMRHYKGFLE